MGICPVTTPTLSVSLTININESVSTIPFLEVFSMSGKMKLLALDIFLVNGGSNQRMDLAIDQIVRGSF